MTRKRYIISIHAPRTGRDGRQLCGRVRRGYFNPRSPHGERRCPALRPIRRRHFNPRSPHGERPAYTFRCWLLRLDFNPRSPHGERPLQFRGHDFLDRISIHAPRTGSDAGALLRRVASGLFQSTLPARGATRAVRRLAVAAAISIHAPRTGSDISSGNISMGDLISIHAPRTGSDAVVLFRRCNQRISIHAPRTGSDEQRTCA